MAHQQGGVVAVGLELPRQPAIEVLDRGLLQDRLFGVHRDLIADSLHSSSQQASNLINDS